MLRADLAPWVRGPYELIRHAEGHRHAGSDTDRRLALIGYDNAVEVCLGVCLNLHPKPCTQVELLKDDGERVLATYQTKVELLDNGPPRAGTGSTIQVKTSPRAHAPSRTAPLDDSSRAGARARRRARRGDTEHG